MAGSRHFHPSQDVDGSDSCQQKHLRRTFKNRAFKSPQIILYLILFSPSLDIRAVCGPLRTIKAQVYL